MPRGLSVHSDRATTLAGKRRTHQTPYSQMRKGPGTGSQGLPRPWGQGVARFLVLGREHHFRRVSNFEPTSHAGAGNGRADGRVPQAAGRGPEVRTHPPAANPAEG